MTSKKQSSLRKISSKNWQVPTHKVFEFKPKKNKYCVCIPIINEGEKIKKQLDKMKPLTKIVDIIICDGGSSDGSTDHKFLKSKGVRTLLVKTGPGKQGAQLRIGFAYALKQGYGGIIQIDGNNKDGVEAIPDFVKALDEGYDYIQGSRFIKGGKAINTPWSRWIGIRLISSPIASLAAGFWYTDVPNGFRGFSNRYLLHPDVQIFRNIFVRYEQILYLTIRANQLGFKTKELPVARIYPKGKVPTKISFISGNSDFLLTTFKAALGYYHPKKSVLE